MISGSSRFFLRISIILISIVILMGTYVKTFRDTFIGSYYLGVLHGFLIVMSVSLIVLAFFLGLDYIENSDLGGENKI